MSRWGSFPRWVGDRLSDFPAGNNAGSHMAALRVYLALALAADFKTRIASVSWSDLQDFTGLSRPLIKRGIVSAESVGIIEVDRSGGTHSYRLLARGEEPDFTKVPVDPVRNALPELPTRGFHALDALKVYITLLTVRDRNSGKAFIGHRKLAARSGVQPRRIRAAIDVLINHHLIHMDRAESASAGHPYNVYEIIGFPGADRTFVPAASGEAQAATLPSPTTAAPNPAVLKLPIVDEDAPL